MSSNFGNDFQNLSFNYRLGNFRFWMLVRSMVVFSGWLASATVGNGRSHWKLLKLFVSGSWSISSGRVPATYDVVLLFYPSGKHGPRFLVHLTILILKLRLSRSVEQDTEIRCVRCLSPLPNPAAARPRRAAPLRSRALKTCAACMSRDFGS